MEIPLVHDIKSEHVRTSENSAMTFIKLEESSNEMDLTEADHHDNCKSEDKNFITIKDEFCDQDNRETDKRLKIPDDYEKLEFEGDELNRSSQLLPNEEIPLLCSESDSGSLNNFNCDECDYRCSSNINLMKGLNASQIHKLIEEATLADFPEDSEDSEEWDPESELDEAFILEAETSEVIEEEEEDEEEAEREASFLGFDPPKWKKKNEAVTSFSDFDQKVGPTEYMKRCLQDEANESGIYNTLIGEDLYEHMVYQTNLYATQRQKGYRATTVSEIKQFIAINLIMGIKKYPSYRDAWSSDPMLRDAYISNIMSVKRFEWLISHFHLNDNDKTPPRGSDNLYKLRPFLDLLNDHYTKCYSPTEYQAVDESMIKFKGRIGFKKYIPNKPPKRGYKVWVRADSYGYTCQFDIYTGKGTDEKGSNLGERVVKNLCTSLKGKSYKVYADNFFSSIPLASYLLTEKIGYCGTIRKNRKYFPEFKDDKEMKRGDLDWRMSSDGLSITKWKDNKVVYFISNMNDPSKMLSVNRKNKDGTAREIGGNEVIKDYNKHMGSVDKADMLKNVYGLDRKSKKWWHRILFHFLDVTLVNAFIIFMQLGGERTKIPLKNFKLKVVHGLVGAASFKSPGPCNKRKCSNEVTMHPCLPNRHKAKIDNAIKLDGSEHMPTLVEKYRRCNLCSTRIQPHRTRYMCTVCKVPLCNNSKQCFKIFHQK